MQLSIALVGAKQSLENILLCHDEMMRSCKITYLTYTSLEDLKRTYIQNMSRFDGFLFCGSFPRDYITATVGKISKPNQYVELQDRDYYLMIARLYAQHPGLDFTRVYIDMMLNHSYFSRVFEPGQGPYLPEYLPLKEDAMRSTSYEHYLNYYRSLWQDKKFDIFVTRFSNLANRLEQEHIPHFLLLPSKETILDCFQRLISDIQATVIQQSLVACCVITLDSNDQCSENFNRLEQHIKRFHSTCSQGFITRRNAYSFELTTSCGQANEITMDQTFCQLSDTLRRQLPFELYIGWGISYDVLGALKNAKYAISSAKRKKGQYTFLITENQELVGPLNGSASLKYDLRPSAHISSLAKNIGISPLNLEKIISLYQTRNMVKVTSSDLVYYLDITSRSASRILTKLSQKGFAQPRTCVNLNGTGRPTIVYEINFETLISHSDPNHF